MGHLVEVTRTDPAGEPMTERFGPWDWTHADLERRRLLATFTREHPAEAAAGRFRAAVVEVAP